MLLAGHCVALRRPQHGRCPFDTSPYRSVRLLVIDGYCYLESKPGRRLFSAYVSTDLAGRRTDYRCVFTPYSYAVGRVSASLWAFLAKLLSTPGRGGSSPHTSGALPRVRIPTARCAAQFVDLKTTGSGLAVRRGCEQQYCKNLTKCPPWEEVEHDRLSSQAAQRHRIPLLVWRGEVWCQVSHLRFHQRQEPYLRRRDRRRSLSSLPSVWHVGQ